MRKNLWKLKKSELTPEEDKWLRSKRKEYGQRYKSKRNDRVRERYKNDPNFREKLVKRAQIYRRKNKQLISQRNRRKYNNPDFRKAKLEKHKEWRSRNREWSRKYMNEWYHKKGKLDIQHVLKERLRSRLRSVIKSKGRIAVASARDLCGCTISELMLHLQNQFKKGMHWNNYGKWHIDHIRPCASFDLTDPEQQRQCFHYTNLQPLWARENIQKGARLITT